MRQLRAEARAVQSAIPSFTSKCKWVNIFQTMNALAKYRIGKHHPCSSDRHRKLATRSRIDASLQPQNQQNATRSQSTTSARMAGTRPQRSSKTPIPDARRIGTGRPSHRVYEAHSGRPLCFTMRQAPGLCISFLPANTDTHHG